MTENHYRVPYGRTGRVPMPYGTARKIAEMSLFARMAQLMMGPRVIAALLDEIDDSHHQVADLGTIVSDLTDMLANSGDSILEVNRARKGAQAEAALHFDMVQKLGLENQRLRDRLAAQHREASS